MAGLVIPNKGYKPFQPERHRRHYPFYGHAAASLHMLNIRRFIVMANARRVLLCQ